MEHGELMLYLFIVLLSVIAITLLGELIYMVVCDIMRVAV